MGTPLTTDELDSGVELINQRKIELTLIDEKNIESNIIQEYLKKLRNLLDTLK